MFSDLVNYNWNLENIIILEFVFTDYVLLKKFLFNSLFRHCLSFYSLPFICSFVAVILNLLLELVSHLSFKNGSAERDSSIAFSYKWRRFGRRFYYVCIRI